MTYTAEPLLREETERAVSVLVVDDEQDHRDLIARRLIMSGARVATSDGRDALESASAGIDIVVLDYRMRGLNGLDLLRAIRARPLAPSVVMVTGMGSEEVAIECMRAGASDYVIKDRNYLAALPTVVQRAWRHHDVERRARELQRLAMLVGQAPDWDSLLDEVIRGAMTLLAADECELVTSSGRAGTGSARADGELFELRVPVATAELGRVGYLVARRRAREFSSDERDLASSLAGFAAMAWASLHRLELERSLVRELQQTLDVRRHIAAGVSHELRTPLTAISGFAQTLLGNWDRLDEATRLDMIGRVRGNALELTALVEQLLDFAAVEAGRARANLVCVPLAEAAESAVADLAPLLTDRTVVVDVDPAFRVVADPDLLRRTLYNLLANAAKYTPVEAAVAVRAHVVDDGARVRVEVADTGAGLSDEEVERAFEAFWRAESNRRSQRGNGIGLSLVRDYVRLMDGDVGVESTRGEGSIFWFTLRVSPPGPGGQAGSPAPD